MLYSLLYSINNCSSFDITLRSVSGGLCTLAIDYVAFGCIVLAITVVWVVSEKTSEY